MNLVIAILIDLAGTAVEGQKAKAAWFNLSVVHGLEAVT